MENESKDKLFKIFKAEIIAIVVLFALIMATGIFALVLMFIIPFIPIIFIIPLFFHVRKFKCRPLWSVFFLAVNVIAAVYFIWSLWLNDPINHSAWH